MNDFVAETAAADVVDSPPTSAPAERPPSAEASTLKSLPIYSRSLLRIQVPVTVTLASKKQSLGKIVEIVPGAILQFDKSCDEMLDLEVGSLPIAQGECVKVGDKFGIRVTAMTLPAERYSSVAAVSG